jgi:hypothetical protein
MDEAERQYRQPRGAQEREQEQRYQQWQQERARERDPRYAWMREASPRLILIHPG